MHHQDHPLVIAAGDATFSAIYKRPESPTATVVVAHGAGAGMDHPFLHGFADALNGLGLATLRFNFPYREAGRKFPDRPPAAIAAWRAAMDTARARAEAHGDSGPVWAAGKSFGGRMASMAVAEGMEAQGLVYLGYPLHAPGKPEKLRDEHMYGITVPMLFLQGTRDTFATPHILTDVVARIGSNAVLQWVEGGDHSFAVAGNKRPADQVGASLALPVAEFIAAHT
ncbi:alpha/beta family hydrolase [Pseudarthrobacter sp. efr-133-R2A-89]|uniref:alpha/beta hydrolase family protein n=1 Tax=Pseudarthrobacter sp. efr-133-R2A-89 TaxID=3040302 RepID=UPI0025571617|nr:alpha/beta family hydrolase [Pseudarthrobacter sp. efr-133-R2A-89]